MEKKTQQQWVQIKRHNRWDDTEWAYPVEGATGGIDLQSQFFSLGRGCLVSSAVVYNEWGSCSRLRGGGFRLRVRCVQPKNLDPKSRPRGCSDSLHRLDSRRLPRCAVSWVLRCIVGATTFCEHCVVSHVTLETMCFVGNCEKLKLPEDMLQRRRFVLSARVWWTC